MDKFTFNGSDFKIPDIATGKIIPHEMQRIEMEREKALQEKRADRRHNWSVAIVSAVIGAAVGGIAGYIVALLTLKTG